MGNGENEIFGPIIGSFC